MDAKTAHAYSSYTERDTISERIRPEYLGPLAEMERFTVSLTLAPSLAIEAGSARSGVRNSAVVSA
jgi:hypothetical protein